MGRDGRISRMVLVRLLLSQKERDGEKIVHGAVLVRPVSAVQRSENEHGQDAPREEFEEQLGLLHALSRHLHFSRRLGRLCLLRRRERRRRRRKKTLFRTVLWCRRRCFGRPWGQLALTIQDDKLSS